MLTDHETRLRDLFDKVFGGCLGFDGQMMAMREALLAAEASGYQKGLEAAAKVCSDAAEAERVKCASVEDMDGTGEDEDRHDAKVIHAAGEFLADMLAARILSPNGPCAIPQASEHTTQMSKYHLLTLDHGDVAIARAPFPHEVPAGSGWIEFEGATYRDVGRVRADRWDNPSMIAKMILNSLEFGSLTEKDVQTHISKGEV